jgi:CO/xanthine dehydrogenase Mo-binding subunit
MARIKSITFEKALKLPGVYAVVTGDDLPEVASKTEQVGEGAVNPRYLSMNILARDKAVYDGHAIAAVAASDRHAAEEALRLIEVEYEVLPPVMTVEEAMKPDAPILLAELRNKEDGLDKQTNVANHIQFKRGDLAEGFKGEVLRATGPTSGSTIRCKMGATKKGKIVAAEIWMAYEAGGFPGSPVGAGAMTVINSYNIPNPESMLTTSL